MYLGLQQGSTDVQQHVAGAAALAAAAELQELQPCPVHHQDEEMPSVSAPDLDFVHGVPAPGIVGIDEHGQQEATLGELGVPAGAEAFAAQHMGAGEDLQQLEAEAEAARVEAEQQEVEDQVRLLEEEEREAEGKYG